MKKTVISLSLAITYILFCMTASFASEPKNIALYKTKLMQYHDSGAYQQDEASVIAQAIAYLKTRIATPSAKPLAIVLDIDETSLSNYQDMLTLDFGGTLADITRAENKGKDPAIKPTLELYQFAKAHNVAVFFITGRTEDARAATIKNLQAAGYTNWNGLILKSPNYHKKSASVYKTEARKALAAQGYDIVLNIGDQNSDLVGGYADKTLKLPNPYYFIP